MRRLKPFDPEAYQRELDAKCAKAGAAWMPKRKRIGAADLRDMVPDTPTDDAELTGETDFPDNEYSATSAPR